MSDPSNNPWDLAWALADTFMRNVERAAAASHRPAYVEAIWLDANSRMVMAGAVLNMPEMQAIGAALASMAPGGANDDSAAQEGTWDWRHLPPSIQEWALTCTTEEAER